MFGNALHIKKTLDWLRLLNTYENRLEKDYRELDGMIALSVFSMPSSESSYISCLQEMQFPYAALVMNSKRTVHHPDVIEFCNPSGDGYIIMNEAKVPHFTTRIDDGLRLLENARWFISHTGLIKCQYRDSKFLERMQTPALSLCAAGLRLHSISHDLVMSLSG